EETAPAPVADFVLSAEQLAPAVLPTSAPPVGAPAVAGAETIEPAPPLDLVLPAEQLAPIALPTEAPTIVVAQVEETTPAPVADFVLSAEQLAPAVLPTSAPPVGAPPVAIAQDPAPVVVAQAPEPAPEEAPDFTLPSDQLAPIALPTEAPAIVVAQIEQATSQASEVASAPGGDEIPTLVAVPIGDPEDQRFVSGKAIIRHGDNLWTIARRVYGAGISYTMIFDANKAQIRDPDLIYPGQVFDLPENSPE
ncbi:MAG TPA: LysM peptidoglycan-binding domain-containing protein, partial [Devosia sp.]|nr:LysM peptidoglycan-binding domain-containing protein [Devosia sp.]